VEGQWVLGCCIITNSINIVLLTNGTVTIVVIAASFLCLPVTYTRTIAGWLKHHRLWIVFFFRFALLELFTIAIHIQNSKAIFAIGLTAQVLCLKDIFRI
jgi:hypothetical protein